MAGTSADAIVEMGERMLKEKDARIAHLEAALREIADSYTSELYDRPLAFKMSRIARKALCKPTV